ncbi:hypothetical protein NKH77_19620 [Streptomyces sp. M19]
MGGGRRRLRRQPAPPPRLHGGVRGHRGPRRRADLDRRGRLHRDPAGAGRGGLVHARHRAPHGPGRRPQGHRADAEQRAARGGRRGLHLPRRGARRPGRVRRGGHPARPGGAETDAAAPPPGPGGRGLPGAAGGARGRRQRPLRAFHRAAAGIVAPRSRPGSPLARGRPRRRHPHRGPPRGARRGRPAHLARARVRAAEPSRRGGYGMCGRRDEYELPGATLPYYGE